MRSLLLLAVATSMLVACGGGSGVVPQIPVTLSGNWQFTVSGPPDQSFLGGLQGGFLLQNGGSATGAALYSVSVPGQGGGPATVCNSGSAAITGTLTGQDVTLTAVAGTQTFTFTGMLSIDGTAMVGTYTSTAGRATDGTHCGTAQTGLQWSAAVVPPLLGSVQGSFHSTGGAAGLDNRDFLVSGLLNQGDNTGGSSATVTGALHFDDPLTLLSDYPCFETATVTGTISGNVVLLQMVGPDGSNVGQIGGSAGSGLGAVTFDSTPRGYVLHSLTGTAYDVSSKSCPGVAPSGDGDFGNICLGLSASTCQQPFTISPASLEFPAQLVGSTSTAQKVTLTNTSTGILTGLSWTFTNGTAETNFEVTGDTCDISGDPLGSTFNLDLAQACTISISFTPHQACTTGSNQCSSPLTASLTLTSPASPDNDTAFAVPITGSGVTASAASSPKLHSAGDGASGARLPQVAVVRARGSSPDPAWLK